MFCPTSNLAFVIPSEAKESVYDIATPVCRNTALRCGGTSLGFLAITMYGNVRDRTLALQPCNIRLGLLTDITVLAPAPFPIIGV